MFITIALSFRKPMIASHPQSNSDRLLLSGTLYVQSDRPLIPQASDRKSPQIKQRSPIFSDTINVQSDRSLIPQTNDRASS
ncbi:hypothetical protein [Phormidium tenue]|uniref:Uncharacterized protein n=1 Tax=Phormidium tenue FACHB-1050 TaxID=2692857 RepID=A0ABR8C5I2_9CYAN|nr:hypothetical protein [Phormidium tenue]MBD2315585.1 hypothetical protein [Phormidium tenue FACHB-1050]